MKYIPKLRSKSLRMCLPLLFKRPKKLSNLSSFLSDSMSGLASISGRHNSSFKTTAVIKIEVLSLRSFLSLYLSGLLLHYSQFKMIFIYHALGLGIVS